MQNDTVDLKNKIKSHVAKTFYMRISFLLNLILEKATYLYQNNLHYRKHLPGNGNCDLISALIAGDKHAYSGKKGGSDVIALKLKNLILPTFTSWV